MCSTIILLDPACRVVVDTGNPLVSHIQGGRSKWHRNNPFTPLNYPNCRNAWIDEYHVIRFGESLSKVLVHFYTPAPNFALLFENHSDATFRKYRMNVLKELNVQVWILD